jgi:hypothetical protein
MLLCCLAFDPGYVILVSNKPKVNKLLTTAGIAAALLARFDTAWVNISKFF